MDNPSTSVWDCADCAGKVNEPELLEAMLFAKSSPAVPAAAAAEESWRMPEAVTEEPS